MKIRTPFLFCCLLVAGASPLMADLHVSLIPNPAGPQPLGTTITWTATVIGDPDPNPTYEYTFSAEPKGSPVQVKKGYGHSKTWTWTPSSFEGIFTIGATVKNVHAGTSGSTTASYTLTTRLPNGTSVHAAVNPTNHPLVALFSGPSCQVPNYMIVRFTPQTTPPGGITTPMTTNPVPCRYNPQSQNPDATSMNFYIAGMYPSTTYTMHWETHSPAGVLRVRGADFSFTTGQIPSNLDFPLFSSTGTTSDPQEPITLHSVVPIPVHGEVYTSAAVDLAGNILWYGLLGPVRTEPGGNSWGFLGGNDTYVAGIQEVDLAGNPVLETTVGAVNEQLAVLGIRPITGLHHEARLITTPDGSGPNGYILALGSAEQICTDCQGGTPQNPVDVLGDEIIVLDQNLNVVWAWDSFAFLDINQEAILGETCMHGGAGCEPFSQQFTQANDWTHSNSLQYTPYDGNIIISIRHQDVVLKVNFNYAAGDGHIVWKLGGGPIGGPGGAPLPSFTLFTIGTGGPDLGYPWFSHQHDAEIEFGGYLFGNFRVLTLFDDGNTRIAEYDPQGDSRCHILAVDETDLIANLNTNGDVLSYSPALGSAQILKNGNLMCDSGFIGGPQHSGTDPLTQTVEMDQQGNFIFSLNAAEDSYRTFRMQDMYTAINP